MYFFSQQDFYHKKIMDACSICLETVNYGIHTDCGHVFHNKCLERWIRSSVGFNCATCPLCRFEMKESILDEIKKNSKRVVYLQMLKSVEHYM